jgi:transcriptional regulator with XRE-family HTH domain
MSTTPGQTVSEILAERVRSVRERRHWTQQELADRLQSFDGTQWKQPTIAKVESGKREVTVEELVALAFALGVSPAALMLPADDEALVRLTPNTVAGAGSVLSWIRGTSPMGGTRIGETQSVDNVRFYEDERTDGQARAERALPGITRLTWDATMALMLASLREVQTTSTTWADVATALHGIEVRARALEAEAKDNAKRLAGGN